MKPHPYHHALVASLLAAAGLAPWISFARADALPGNEKEPGPALRAGETWTYEPGFGITFVGVAADTRRSAASRPNFPRCPTLRRPASTKVVGNAVVVLVLKAGNQKARTVRLGTHRGRTYAVIPAQIFPPGVVGIPKSYLVSVHELLPRHSRRKGRHPQRAYRLRLAVDVAV